MKKNPVLALLVGVLLICGLCAMWISVRYYFSLKALEQEYQRIQIQKAAISNVRGYVQSLAKETVTYAQRNPALVPLLAQFDLIEKHAALNPPGPRPPSR